MSLLMDALRKAEESKKQAEQEKNKVSSAPVPDSVVEHKPSDTAAQPTTNHAPNPTPSPLPVETDLELAGSAMKSDESGVSNPAEASASDPAADENSLEYKQEPETDQPTLELEPRSKTGIRAPSYTEDQLQLSVNNEADDKNSLALSASDQRDDDAASVSSFLGSVELNEAVSRASEELEKQRTAKSSDSEAATNDLSDGRLEKPNEVEPLAEKLPPSAPEIQKESIRERTADSRRSAKSVFTAKQFAQKERQKLIIPAAGIAAVILLGLGLYLYVGLNSNTGISVATDNFPDTLSNDLSDQNDQLRSDVDDSAGLQLVNSADSIDQVAEVAEVQPAEEESLFSSAASVIEIGSNLLEEQIASGASIESLVISDAPEVEDFLPRDIQTADVQSQMSTTALGSGVVAEVAVEANEEVSLSAPAIESAPVSTKTTESEPAYSLGSLARAEPASLVAPRELVSFRKTSQERGISPELSEGFRAYQNGDIEIARELYEQTLSESPENIDALLGLAAIAAREQETGLSLGLYARVLVLDPSNTFAKTAIREMAPLGSPAEQEKELRRLNAENPNVAPLAFALGNFYAGQSRWSDAQQFYFRALQLAKSAGQTGAVVSPDYAFNLAVSLERLNQSKPAASFYEEALALATRSPANFDLGIARNRLNSLIGAGKP